MTASIALSRTWKKYQAPLTFFIIVMLLVFLVYFMYNGQKGSKPRPTHNTQNLHTQTSIQSVQTRRKPQTPTEQSKKPQRVQENIQKAQSSDQTREAQSLENVPPIDTLQTDYNALEDKICEIPKLDLMNDDNKNYYYQLKPLVCNTTERFFYLDDNCVLRLNSTAVDEKGIAFCSYRAIDRITDKTFAYSHPIQRISNYEVKINHDFFTVDCYLKKGNYQEDVEQNQNIQPLQTKIVKRAVDINQMKPYTNLTFNTVQDYESKSWTSVVIDWVKPKVYKTPPGFQQLFAQIFPKKSVFERVKNIKPSENSTQLNVIIFGIDSISHLAYQRSLPQTYNYLKYRLGAAVMESYNVVGDGATGAYIPLLTGKKESELPSISWGPFSQYADVYPLIWKEFEKNGYVTMYGEDYPLIETFQMRMTGFDEAPVDHYMRPFWQAAYDMDPNLKKKGTSPCVMGKARFKYMLDYLKDFYVKYNTIPKFTFQHLNGMSSEDPNMIQHADQALVEFLTWYESSGLMANTLLIMMSDHGSRFSSIQKTAQGKLEERLPMMSVLIPTYLQEKFADISWNIRNNAERLTTPFDVHEMLRTVLNIDLARSALPLDDPTVMKSPVRGISLMRPIPEMRSCEDAGISLHWCTCLEYEKLSSEDGLARDLGYYLISMINNETEKVRNKCIELHLQRVIEIRLLHPNNKIARIDDISDFDMDVAHYEVTIETTPNDGVYEATVRGYVSDHTIKVLGHISRINKYDDQSKCMINQHKELRQYCLCRP